MKALIFGSSGQDGLYLTDLLHSENIDVVRISRRNADITGDVKDYGFVKSQVNDFRPDYIFHLAANSTTKHSALFENHETISTGTINILESVKLHCPQAKVFLSGSAMQFKNEGLPIDEQTPFAANNPYAVARIHSVYAARYYRDVLGLFVYVGYFFNHDSPFRTEQHINKRITAAAKRIANGTKEKLKIGNINVRKEFNFAGDMMQAAWQLVNQDKIFEAVIGCGKAYSIRDWIEYCFNKVNLSWEKFVVQRKDFVNEYDTLVSNPKLIKSIGWRAKVDFEQLADLMMEDK
jgi:GDPmannose 4,6-dehydratase